MALDGRMDDDDVIPLEIIAVDLIVAAETAIAAVVVPAAMLKSISRNRDKEDISGMRPVSTSNPGNGNLFI